VDLADAIDLLGSASLDGQGPTIWADLGCGDGTFTRALAARLAAGSTIHAMDRNRRALGGLPAQADEVRIETHHGDFTKLPWPFADLNGILMANSLHYVREQADFVRRCMASLSSHGHFVIVEYDTDVANPWVPYPVSRAALADLFDTVGDVEIETLGTRPSIYNSAGFYAALVRT
jgi:trans-aconitate methyltransferase